MKARTALIYKDSEIEVYGLPRWTPRLPTGKPCPACGNPLTRKAGFAVIARVNVGDAVASHVEPEMVRVQRYCCQRCGKNFRDEPK